jgi:multidrug efflux pump subunit AcrB
MSAARVEQLLVKPIEEAARQIAEVDTIESAAQTGLATVKVELRPDVTQVKPVWTTLRDRMTDLGPSLPEGTVGPLVNDDYGRVAVTTLALHGADFSPAVLRRFRRLGASTSTACRRSGSGSSLTAPVWIRPG